MRNHTLAVVVALAAATLTGAATTPRTGTNLAIEQALLRLPYYGVFDFLAYRLDKGVVTLAGQVHAGSLRADAERAIARVDGIDEIANTIEILPRSPADDRIRWATFYSIYTDEFLSRYTPGGRMSARYEARSLARFPGMQPYGMYPIHIIVKNGRTTLVGVVDRDSDRAIAGLRAREIPGVFSIENDIVVEGN